jgi:hypothetical protein
MFILSDRLYNGAKRFVQIILPAISALYFGLATIWGLPEPDKVVGTIACVQLFLGICLGISSKTYNALDVGNVGNLHITENENGKMTYLLELTSEPEYIDGKAEVTFKVLKETLPT